MPLESSPTRGSIDIFSRKAAPVIAVQDGKIVDIGHNQRLGRYMVLEDVYGNPLPRHRQHPVAARPRQPHPRRVPPHVQTNSKMGRQLAAILKPGQWVKLIDRLNAIPNPTVRVKPSKYAIRAKRSNGRD